MTLTTDRHQVEIATPDYQLEPGCSHPFGAVPDKEGVNFSIFSEHGTSVELLLFDRDDSPQPTKIIQLNPKINKTFHFWHVYVRGLKAGAHYAYRVHGNSDLHQEGHRFNENKVLLDPYARGNTNTLWQRNDALGSKDNMATSMRSVVIDISDYDWEGDRPSITP